MRQISRRAYGNGVVHGAVFKRLIVLLIRVLLAQRLLLKYLHGNVQNVIMVAFKERWVNRVDHFQEAHAERRDNGPSNN